MRGGGHAAKSVLLFRIDFGADLGAPGGRFGQKWRKGKGPDFGWTFWKTLWKGGLELSFWGCGWSSLVPPRRRVVYKYDNGWNTASIGIYAFLGVSKPRMKERMGSI